MNPKALTTLELIERKAKGPSIAMVTAYDATFASLLEAAGVDMLLVGDSLGMVVQGHQNTLQVTLDDMIYHTRAVARGAQHTHIVADLPFMSYQVSSDDALRSAGALMQRGLAHAVKLEGGAEMAPTAHRLVTAGIPVMGHIGLTPQSVHRLGGFRVQGRSPTDAKRLLQAASELAQAGCYSMVLEGIPGDLAHQISRSIDIPTIGIGAGPQCDGQVLVCYDLLGMNPDFQPKFLKTYENLAQRITDAATNFVHEVRDGRFPTKAHTFFSPQLAPVGHASDDAANNGHS